MTEKASFEVTPRAANLGGGYKLRLLDTDGSEAGGGVFPLDEYGYAENPDDAAYADAYNEGMAWMATRGEPVLYSYKCAGCGKRGERHLFGDGHSHETTTCDNCGAEVCLEWDGGVRLD
jgi:DNA-directed RNA polymerase subunit RPC12/RpoP